MFTEDKITKMFYISDDFCKFYDTQMSKYTPVRVKIRIKRVVLYPL